MTRFHVAAALAAVFAGGTVAALPAAAADAADTVAASGATDALAMPAGWRLKGVLIFSRHGIRGPLNPASCDNVAVPGQCMNAISSQAWPTFGVMAANLIPDGYARVATLGRYYRAHYAAAGILPEKGCPAAATITSDATERTVMTAGALADGMFPGCAPSFTIDPQVYDGASCGFDSAKAAAASQALVGGSWKKAADGDLRRPLAVMSEVLGPFKPAGCAANGVAAGCTLSTVPVTASNPGRISTADQPSEQFLMQYAAGLPAKKVAWGRLPGASGRSLPDAITEVNAVHALAFRGAYMPKYQAAKDGSQVMSVVLNGLDAVVNGRGAPPVQVYAGHDNNILNMAGLLGLEWTLASYQPFQVPPGGAVAFEVWQPPQGQAAVRLVYFAQTIRQMRDNVELSAKRPPAAAVMPVAGCTSERGACRWGDFRRIVRAAIEPACVRR